MEARKTKINTPEKEKQQNNESKRLTKNIVKEQWQPSHMNRINGVHISKTWAMFTRCDVFSQAEKKIYKTMKLNVFIMTFHVHYNLSIL